ncbi:similar to Saccharomyces cerevisiae YJR046W TAH11 DNA replication licensing factor, required for pre-replication complex assembly [Maudiozyma saulgeensis]|uniref:Similar to Saccharomyces cerevisiae YJR046W TAH11 DNA replication licensing factor, required for pre-replication complex assembly n=1 Tax=Maudiozyma saulgeensis TaxID=1789683 RepID=A0A1X7R149_9SACH|nr:similar to Saccharomyces cerevisiae YJR046W TAH11 DNA replication licensing factor, required for pre-replication complex assembly [Kazachstania saulgeensis]
MSNADRKYIVPAIDLNKISNEEQLLPVIKAILLNHDTFLLKNYANKESLDNLLFDLKDCPPDLNQGFDANFTGTLPLDQENNIYLEQYISNPGNALQFDRPCNNVCLSKLQSRLNKVAHYFATLSIKAINQIEPNLLKTLTENEALKLTRYYNGTANNNNNTGLLSDPLADVLGLTASFSNNNDGNENNEVISGHYTKHDCAGLLSVFPTTNGIRYKPTSVASDDNIWVPIQNDPTALVIHVGKLLSIVSDGLFTSSPLQVDTAANIVELTIFPNLTTSFEDNGNITMASTLLEQQIKEFPLVAQKFYYKQWSKQQLLEKINFYKKLFTTSETVLSLYAMSRGSTVAPRLDNLLPQMTNLLKRKISEQDFLKMITLWPQVYILGSDSNHELTVQLPRRDILASLTNNSRKLDFIQFAEEWYMNQSQLESIPLDVPIFKINKRRGSDNYELHGDLHKKDNHRVDNDNYSSMSRSRNYLSNNRDPSNLLTKDKSRNNSQSDLLKRLQEKERRSATLLQERQQKYQQFLTIKMKQVFNIIFSLQPNVPYTMTHLKAIIVDSLQDSNNPIGPEEAEEVLLRLHSLLIDNISVKTVDGGLKVLRWNNLNQEQFDIALASFNPNSN